MYGVVLWSDRQSDRALIWCEDHGNLAYYHADANNEHDFICEAGDLVRFQLRDTPQMRYAEQPEVIAAEEYPLIANSLRQAGQGDIGQVALTPASASNGKIIPFDPIRARTEQRTVMATAKFATR